MSENYENFRSLIDNATDLIVVINADGRFTYTSPSAERITGFKPAEVIGKQFASFINPEDSENIFSKFETAMKTNDIVEINEFRTKKKDGSWISLAGSGRCIIDSSGIAKIIAYLHDITDEKKATQSLKESEEKYRVIAETSQDMIFMIGKDGTIEYVNNYAASLFDCKPEDLIGKKQKSIFPPETSDRQADNLKKVFETGKPVYVETESLFPKGIHWVNSWLIPIKDDSKKVRSVFGISRDLTSRKIMEEELKRRTLEAEEAQNRAQTFFDFLAHDIANMISPIMSYSEATLMKGDISPEIKTYTEKTQEQVKEIASLIFNLRLLAEAEKISIDAAENLDIRETMREIGRSVSGHYPHKKFKMSFEGPDKRIIVVGGKPLRNALILGLNKAAKYAVDKEIDIKMKASEVKDEDKEFWQLKLIVPSFALPTNLREAFSSPFEITRQKMKGYARNMSFVSSIIEHFGGKIWLEDIESDDQSKGFIIFMNLLKANE